VRDTRARLFGAFTALAGIALAGNVSAWDSTEHASFGRAAFWDACQNTKDTIACSNSANQTLAGAALAEPDYCHSFWYSKIGIQLNPTNAAGRQNCAIEYGQPLPKAPSSNAFGIPLTNNYDDSLHYLLYVLMTNANHFGGNTETHFLAYHTLALQAAQLRADLGKFYTKAPSSEVTSPNPLLNVCVQDAVGIEGYALHYLTDRAAGGHAWNAPPHYSKTDSNLQAGGAMRSCFHGQALSTRVAGTTKGFDCVDSPLLGNSGNPVRQGLGDSPRAFGGMYWAGGGTGWVSDDSFFTGQPAKGLPPAPSSQSVATRSPAVQAFTAVLQTLNGQSQGAFPWSDTFVSNRDFCKVMLSECCRSASVGSIGTCSACAPDISDSTIKQHCTVGTVQSAPVSGTEWVTLEPNHYVPKLNPLLYAQLTLSSDDGTDAAQSISSSTGNVHEDAQWDQSNSLVAMLGCAKFDMNDTTLPLVPTGSSGVNVSVTLQGNPVFPVTLHWRANTDASEGPVCTPSDDIPGLCSPQDLTINTNPAGASATASDGGAQTLSFPGLSCPDAASGAMPAAAAGVLYLTDANGSWTPAHSATLHCGSLEAGVCSEAAPLQPTGGGVILSCPDPQKLLQCPGEASMTGICGGPNAECCGGGACPNPDGQCYSCGGGYQCITAGCPVPSGCMRDADGGAAGDSGSDSGAFDSGQSFDSGQMSDSGL
jgi:hypothetical protein